MRRRTVLVASAAVLAALLAAPFALVRPPVEPFRPATWVPTEPDPVEVQLPVGDASRPLTDAVLDGPEDIALGRDGLLYASTRAGTIVRADPETGAVMPFAEVGGRPLGLRFGADGELYVANQGIGLQAVSPNGAVRLIADAADGEPIHSANDLDIGPDGTVYLTDSNRIYTPQALGERTSYSLYDFLDGRALGRVIAVDPVSGRARVLADGLHFPNGIVLSADARSVLVAESTRYRVTRIGIAGEGPGEREVFLDNVPGISDGFTRDASGHLILAAYERVPALDEVVLPSLVARHVAVRLPEDLLAGDPLPGMLLELGEDGRIVRAFTGLDPAATTITPWGDSWVLGALLDQPLRAMPAPG